MNHSERLVKGVLCTVCLLVSVGPAADAAIDTSAWIPYEMPNLRQLKGTTFDMRAASKCMHYELVRD